MWVCMWLSKKGENSYILYEYREEKESLWGNKKADWTTNVFMKAKALQPKDALGYVWKIVAEENNSLSSQWKEPKIFYIARCKTER